MNKPPPKCEPPLTDYTSCPSSTIQLFSYPVQRQDGEAPMGSIIYSFNTTGNGLRQIFIMASAKAFTRVSLYLYTLPGSLRARLIHSAELPCGRSAQSGLPQSVPSQSLVCRRRWSQVIFLL